MSEAEKLHPEPTLRQRAVEDADAISARIAELHREKEKAWNQPPDKPATAAVDYGCAAMDHGDCCV